MRHNDARKWLHAALDLLPIILIPIFMIYSHRHTIEGASITRAEEVVEEVNFNQIVQTTYKSTNQTYNQYVPALKLDNYLIEDHVYYVNFDVDDYNYYYTWTIGDINVQPNDLTYAVRGGGNFNFNFTYTNDYVNSIYFYRTNNGSALIDVDNYFIVDLTYAFGVGNEPTSAEFKQMFPNSYYAYNTGEIVNVLRSYDEVIYADTDIMSQFTYQLYNAVDKYFNMGNVFHMNNVYQWFNLNIFGGSAPIAIYIVWNIVLYEFVMDLLFLLYGLFMWFIDMCKHLMEKPFRSIK